MFPSSGSFERSHLANVPYPVLGFPPWSVCMQSRHHPRNAVASPCIYIWVESKERNRRAEHNSGVAGCVGWCSVGLFPVILLTSSVDNNESELTAQRVINASYVVVVAQAQEISLESSP